MGGAPVILCGKTEQIGTGVVATLKPEFDGMSYYLPVYLPVYLSVCLQAPFLYLTKSLPSATPYLYRRSRYQLP